MESISKRRLSRRVLVLEDEYVIAEAICAALEEEHFTVAGPYGFLTKAVFKESQMKIDAAVIDLNLHGEMAYQFIDHLLDQSIPLVITTGYGRDSIPARFAKCPIVAKPTDPEVIVAKLRQVLASKCSARREDLH